MQESRLLDRHVGDVDYDRFQNAGDALCRRCATPARLLKYPKKSANAVSRLRAAKPRSPSAAAKIISKFKKPRRGKIPPFQAFASALLTEWLTTLPDSRSDPIGPENKISAMEDQP